MNDADRRAIDLATLDLALDDAGYRSLGECTALGVAALLLATDETALESWYERAPHADFPIARVASRAVDRDDVADRIDATLMRDPGVLDDLRRAAITWSHPELVDLLERPEFRGSAAYMLAHAEPDVLLDWLDAERDPDELVDAARAVAASGIEELFDAFEPWLAAAREAKEPTGQLEAALFVLSPARWARGFIAGDWDAAFLGDSVAMADIVAAAGQSYWTHTLSFFDADSDEFAAVARMIAAGAAASLHFGADELPADLIDAFYREDWVALAQHPAFATAIALAEEEDDWQQPLLESAAHDVLLARGVESPGIAGLPLSSSHPDAEEVGVALELLADREVDPIALVATICDAAEFAAVDGFEALPRAAAALESHSHPAVRAAAKAVTAAVDVAATRADAADPSVRGIAAAERLARAGTAGLHALIDLWADGPPGRATLYAALIQQELAYPQEK